VSARGFARKVRAGLIRADVDVGVDAAGERRRKERRAQQSQAIADPGNIRETAEERARPDLGQQIREARGRVDDRGVHLDRVAAGPKLADLLEHELLAAAGIEEPEMEDRDPERRGHRRAGSAPSTSITGMPLSTGYRRPQDVHTRWLLASVTGA